MATAKTASKTATKKAAKKAVKSKTTTGSKPLASSESLTQRSSRIAKSRHKPGDVIRLAASLIMQADKRFYSVTMPTDMLWQCAFVTTRDSNPIDGFQRVLDPKRAKDIADYIDSEGGTIPGSIILSAQPDANLRSISGGKIIEFTLTPRSFLILDGQHRVFGFSMSETALRVPVVIYSGLSPVEEARLFIDINTKQRQVPNELLLDIKQLAQRENEKDALLREIFDMFAEEPDSALRGLTTSSTRQKNKISRVTFNLAFKTAIAVFSTPNADEVYKVTNSYISAFAEVLGQLGIEERLVVPTVFRAIMDTFSDVARVYAAQYGRSFSKSKFVSILTPIAQKLNANKIAKTASVKDLSEQFSRTLKKDFSI